MDSMEYAHAPREPRKQALTHRPVDLAIVGGGAAGMFAAAVAAEHGLKCLVIERKARLGSKVLMTANGRCNFTKDIDPERFLRDLDAAGEADEVREFASHAIRECGPKRIIQGLKSLGVRLRRMEDGRMFPADGRAATIVHAFGDLLRDSDVPILSNCAVTGIQPQKNGFIVATEGFTLWAKNVLVATGGASYPKLGSVGDGQSFAHQLGHHVVPMRPGLIGVETTDPRVTRQAGRRIENGYACVYDSSGRKMFDYRGEVDCESFGLSGAAVYNCQRWMERYARNRAEANRPPEPLTLEVSLGDGETIRVERPRSRPLKEAIVTIGGVALSEVDPSTMESRIVPGLYFAGEVLDIDGPTGGYNLTLAFATGRLAALAVAEKRPPQPVTSGANGWRQGR